MVKPPPIPHSLAPDEKNPASTTNSTSTVNNDEHDQENEKRDSAYSAGTLSRLAPLPPYRYRSPTTSAFDVDLEGGARPPPNTTANSTLQILTAGVGQFKHANLSSPADIGTYPSRRIRDEEEEVDLGDPLASTDAIRGRARRRAKRHGAGPHATFAPGTHPALRRANSLPSRPPMTAHTVSNNGPSMVKTLNTLLTPERKLAPPPNWYDSFRNTVFHTPLNVMLVFVPIAWGVHYAHLSDTITFVFSFLAIVPLAALLGFATEELALRVGQALGGLLNATFGNAVELIISILALVKGELRIVQASMLGSILSNCLLVLGMCFFAGGFRFHEQGYGVRAAQLNISLLSISVFSIVIPAAFNSSLNFGSHENPNIEQTRATADRSVLAISRGTSIILLFVYAAYLVFQLWTHAYIYSPEASRHHSAQTHASDGIDGPGAPHGRVFRMPHLPSLPSLTIGGRSDTSSSRSRRSSSSSSSSSTSTKSSYHETEEVPKLKPLAAFFLLVAVTIVTGITAEFLVDSIGGMTDQGGISREFVALILLPLVGNAAEHVTAVTVSVKNKLDLAITVAVGSSIQIALFVIPFLVLLGWIIGQPLSLFFDIYETVVVFVSILVVNYAIADGKTNWLEGLVLMIIYVLIALTTWYYPGTNIE